MCRWCRFRGRRRFWRRWWRAACPPIRFASADFFPRSAESGGRRWRRSRVLRGRRFSTKLRIALWRRWKILSKFWEQRRHVVIAREVTKLHEEFLRGRAGEVLENLKAREAVKGEITLLIGKAEESDARGAADASSRPAQYGSGWSRSWRKKKSTRKPR